jgi:hypothetical protein
MPEIGHVHSKKKRKHPVPHKTQEGMANKVHFQNRQCRQGYVSGAVKPFAFPVQQQQSLLPGECMNLEN